MRPRIKGNTCAFKTTSDTALTQHVNLVHKKITNSTSKRQKCKFCSKQFNKNDTYKTHMKKIHHREVQDNQNL